MPIDSLPLPAALIELMARGSWPSNRQESVRQNIVRFIPCDLVKQLADDETEVHLYPPPFLSVYQEAASSNSDFWKECGALDDIQTEKAIMIADFGPGTDSPIILYYRIQGNEPEVWRLKWVEPCLGPSNRWQPMASSFSEFADRLGLAGLQFKVS